MQALKGYMRLKEHQTIKKKFSDSNISTIYQNLYII